MLKSLALAVSLLVAAFAIASATSYTTTVITTAMDGEANPGPFQLCRLLIQGHQFTSCQRYLSPGGFGGRGSEEMGRAVMENPGNQQQHLRDCCRELRQVIENCRCEAVSEAVRQLQQAGGSGQQWEDMQQVYQMARELPNRCGFSQQTCELTAVLV